MSQLNKTEVEAAVKAFKDGDSFYSIHEPNIRVACYLYQGVHYADVSVFQADKSTMFLSTTREGRGGEILGFELYVPSSSNQNHSDVLNAVLGDVHEFRVVQREMFICKGKKRRLITPLTKRTSIDLVEYRLK